MDLERLSRARADLPAGSELHLIEGGSHILMYEKEHYREFQDTIVSFLKQ